MREHTFLDLFHIRRRLDVPAPSAGVAGYFYKIVTFFWKFMALNYLFLLACIPVITFPAALSAANRVCVKLIRDRNVLLWEEFRDEFKSSFKKGVLISLFFAAWMFAAYYFLSLGLTNWETPFGVIFTAIGIIVFTISAVYAAYAFVLLASLDLPVRLLLRNARALMFLGRKYTIGVFAVLLVMVLLLWLFLPAALIISLAGGISFMQYTICWFVNEPMERYIIGPYERSRNQEN